MSYRILIIDDELEMCLSLSEILQKNNYQTLYTTDPLEIKNLIYRERIDLIIMDIKMPKITGIALLKQIKEKNPSIPVIMITGFPSVENAVQAMRYGALNCYVKPLKLQKLLKEINQLASSRIKSKKNILKGKHPGIITKDPVMKRVIETLEIASKTDAPVLLTGESGTGKELAANYLHYSSERADNPLVKVNCAAIPDSLLESELFGHEKGAFTGASKQRIGKFELAYGGTIFLDEIGDMSLKTQSKILRVLQEHEFERLGGAKVVHTNIRVIAATNKDISSLINKTEFREDLYYRLSVIPVHLPALREREGDILFLTHYFIQYFNRMYKKEIEGLSKEVEKVLLNHYWPGNVRELKNCIERAVIFCKQNRITIKELPAQYTEIPDGQKSSNSFLESVNNFNRKLIMDALAKTNGVKHKAAKLLNIDRKTLNSRMKKLGIK